LEEKEGKENKADMPQNYLETMCNLLLIKENYNFRANMTQFGAK